MVKPEQVKTYHDQIGYWLWEPATGTVIQTLTIPRGQVAMAVGKASADDQLRIDRQPRFGDLWNLLDAVSRLCIQDRRIPD